MKINFSADEIMKGMTFGFFGSEKHKVDMETLLTTTDAVFLDVRSKEERDSIDIKLQHHIRVLRIPTDEIPARHEEIPRDTLVGVFCSAGTRSTMVYYYLRTLGYENVRIAPSHYDALTSLLSPGKLYKVIASRMTEGVREGAKE